ncbi:hypothetical protein [Bradyrhizobium sp. CCGB20]|uniref:hypothetical protein n=1 Tax=Bradyrhizobium sp. CCGB20 TaxID=2949633 RepID=UPI0020B3BAB6|nr:hypothetical protein [Bradyrhizobium sp. CCGB20]MCP3397250.1 hypothetical protein [Bradyrhizobium sp. CCGB20]
MKKLALAATLIIAAGFTMPGAAFAKGGHGHGHHGGYHAHRYAVAPGWHHGRKVGWRGRGCPPGLWKQGRC